MAKSIRFAALIRVSTEKQENQGESLNTQRKQIDQAVAAMGGKIVARYAGQEHGTPGWERKQLDQLLKDARRSQKLFDAVIVTDPSRWSRDNVANETGLDILRDRRIRFFVLGMEFDLFDPMHRHILATQAGMNKLTAALQKQKSLLNRIERAKRGIPTGGKLPFGRTFDKETEKWGVIAKKKRLIEHAAKRYLRGESIPNLAAELGMNASSLHKTLMERSGTEWQVEFRADDLNIYEVVPITVPRLLDDEAIKLLRKRAKANKTYEHGQAKHEYLLSGFLYCEHCGYSLSGTPNTTGLLYYRHTEPSNAKNRDCPQPNFSLRADGLEDLVMRHLFDCFGNPQAIQRAIEDATPTLDKDNAHRERLEELSASLMKIAAGRERILRLVAKDTISEAHAEKQLSELKDREEKQRNEVQRIESAIGNAPTQKSIREFAAKISGNINSNRKPKVRGSAYLAACVKHANRHFDEMTFSDKRELVKSVCDGTTIDGRPMGVYVSLREGEERRRHKAWDFRIHGRLIDATDCVSPSIAPDDEDFAFSSRVAQSASH
jgi:site-specific DNA recombinase